MKPWQWVTFGMLGAVIGIAAFRVFSGNTEPVTQERLAQAKELWQQAGISSYDMELEVNARVSAVYQLQVRDGKVTTFECVDGRVKTNDPSYFTIEGLFRTIEEELEQSMDPETTAFPPKSEIWLRMQCDPKLGYPKRYLREVTSTNMGLEMTVRKFELR